MTYEGRQQLIGFALIAIIAVGGIWLAIYFVSALVTADKSIQAAIIAAVVGLFTVTFTYWKERSRSIKEAHRDKKIEVYQKFYEIMFALMEASKKGIVSDASDAEFQAKWFEVSRGVMFYGSPTVLNAFAALKRHKGDAEPKNVFRIMGRILLAMRSDIGLSNFGLDELNIHQIYVNDDINKLGNANEHS
ncbi:hypothetical protein [Rhizobium sp. SAFR-030]|uniref:hypothetical protein n=1 Tax=Rhizobium sp. SAFR-030 TaxID=3387277 RepID=UPI003F822067